MDEKESSDVNGTFWGISMSVGKKYSQKVQSAFHVSMASLYIDNYSNLNREMCVVKVLIEYKGSSFLICSLSPQLILQQALDLNFTIGENVKFQVSCKNPYAQNWQVHLTGYLIPAECDTDELSSLCDENLDYSALLKNLTQSSIDAEQHKEINTTKKKRKLSNDDVKLKKLKKDGTKFEEIKIGKGAVAQENNRVYIYYVGKLENGVEFNSHTDGKPLAFCLNDDTMIKGWHIGIPGMRVGGKRKLIVPPSQGYGKESQGNVPPNSTLIYEIELKSVAQT